MEELLRKVRDNLILEHKDDDGLLQEYITAAVSYAESYQHLGAGYYTEHIMPPTTTSCRRPPNRPSSCLPLIFMNRATAQRQAFSTITRMLRSRCGIPLIFF